MYEDPLSAKITVEPSPVLFDTEQQILVCLKLYEDEELTRLQPMTRKDVEALADISRMGRERLFEWIALLEDMEPHENKVLVLVRLNRWRYWRTSCKRTHGDCYI